MICEKCNERMFPTKVFRLSGCLVVLGVFILICSLGGIGLAGLITVIGTGASATASADMLADAKTLTMDELRDLKAPPYVITEFEETLTVSPETLESLPDKMKRDVELAVSLYSSLVSGTTIGTGLFALAGGSFVAVLLLISIPGLIVGFLLILRKKIMKCSGCGFFFDRA